jgi:crossover junction endodeoxyribonuclease RuvC
MIPVVGIDPGLTRTAVAHGTGAEPEDVLVRTRSSGAARMAFIRRQVELILVELERPLILIEGFPFARQAQAYTFETGGLGWVLRVAMHDLGLRFVEVPPTTLKTFVTGKGNADKIRLTSELTHRTGRVFASDDTADAFGLWCLGRAAIGLSHPMGLLPSSHMRALDKLELPTGWRRP